MPPLAKTLLPILFTTLIASCTAAPTLPELLVDIPPSVVPRDKEIPCSYSNGSDGLVSITKGKEHRILKVRYLSHGTRGCVYDVIEGLPELSPPAVVKTPRPDLYDDYLSPSEVDALHDLGQLILDGFDASGREWAVMKKAQGVLLWDHPEYQKKFPNGYNHMPDSLSDEQRLSAIQDCEHFMNFWYNLLINVFQEALLNHGWEYNDLNWENFRFTVSEPIKAEVIDWGDAVKVHEEDRKLRWALMVRSQ
ncbi:hypothetical protein FRB99_001215 [Tulasnella sp. 403]|nr:hypothetical protein FRB99_001215 [Tulasnella sp. 403]